MTMTYPSLSIRATEAPASPIRSLATLAQEATERGLHVHYLNIGQPDLPSPKSMIDAIHNFNHDQISYAPSDGYPKYLNKLTHYYNSLCHKNQITPEDIVVTTGGSEALLFAIAATCNPTDELLVVEPTYTNYLGIAHMLNVSIRAHTTHPSENYHIDPVKLLDSIGPQTKAICLASPGNPTGTVLSKSDVETLALGCAERNVFLIMDEVYREFIYDQTNGPTSPSALDVPGAENSVIVIDSVSKRYSACGLRVGALVTKRKDLRETALRFGQARLSPPTIGQYAAMSAMDEPTNYIQDAINLYKERRDLLVTSLQNIGINAHPPDGAFYLPLALPIDNAHDFCSFLLSNFEYKQETLCLAPMEGFYHSEGLGKNEVRMAYVLEPEKLVRCTEILGKGLDAYSGIKQ